MVDYGRLGRKGGVVAGSTALCIGVLFLAGRHTHALRRRIAATEAVALPTFHSDVQYFVSGGLWPQEYVRWFNAIRYLRQVRVLHTEFLRQQSLFTLINPLTNSVLFHVPNKTLAIEDFFQSLAPNHRDWLRCLARYNGDPVEDIIGHIATGKPSTPFILHGPLDSVLTCRRPEVQIINGGIVLANIGVVVVWMYGVSTAIIYCAVAA